MEDILLECSQRETNKEVFPIPGQFTTTLAKPTFIYPGDQVVVSKTFIDTQAETSGVISVDDPTEIRMDWCIYTQNWFGQTQLSPALGAPVNTLADGAVEFNTNYGYIWSERKAVADGDFPPLMIRIFALHAYSLQFPSQNGGGGPWGDPTNDKSKKKVTRENPVLFTYLDVLGNEHTARMDIPFAKNGDSPESVRVEVDIVCQWNSINQFKPYRGLDPTSVGGGNWGINWTKRDQGFANGSPCIEFQYNNTPGGGQTPNNPPAKFPARNGPGPPAYVPGAGWFGPNGGKYSSGDGADFCLLVEFTDAPIASKYLTHPLTFSKTFTINAGKYLPADICDLFNQEFDNTNAPRVFAPQHQSSNQLLFNTADIHKSYGGTKSEYLWVSEAAKTLTVPNPLFGIGNNPPRINNPFGGPTNVRMADDKWVGTNQFELAYDPQDQHFYWNYLHMPIYQKASPVTALIAPTTPNIPDSVFQVTRNGGVAFTVLESSSTSQITGEQVPSNFFGNKLGFVEVDMCVTPTQMPAYSRTEPNAAALNGGTGAAGAGNEINTYSGTTFNLTPGVTTTEASSKLDSLIPKGDGKNGLNSAQKAAFTDSFKVTDFPNPPVFPLQNTFASSFNNVIKSTNPAVSGELLDSGYYLLEMRAGLRSNVMDSSKVHTMITGIINRYYSLGSYTSTGVDETLTYTHKGEMMSISDVDIRILTPQKKLAKIGFDNSIFVYVRRGQIAKSIGQPQPPQPPAPPPAAASLPQAKK